MCISQTGPPENMGKVSGGDLKKIKNFQGDSLIDFFYELCGNKDGYVLTAGATFGERMANCMWLKEKIGIDTIVPISQEEEMNATIQSVSNLPTNTGAILAAGSTTIHFCLVFVTGGKATMINNTYWCFPVDKDHQKTSDTISEIIKECAKFKHVIGIAGAPTRAISFENVEQDPYYHYGVKELKGFIGNLGDKGKNHIIIFNKICNNLGC